MTHPQLYVSTITPLPHHVCLPLLEPQTRSQLLSASLTNPSPEDCRRLGVVLGLEDIPLAETGRVECASSPWRRLGQGSSAMIGGRWSDDDAE
jgi:hypothetical protein